VSAGADLARVQINARNRAGIVSRVAANGIDWIIVQIIYFSILGAIALTEFLITGNDLKFPTPHFGATVAAEWAILVLYLGSSWASSGRSIGKSVFGLRVVNANGRELPPGRAFARALLCVTFYFLLLWVVIGRKNQGAYDIVLRTACIYDWVPRV
jgi:uncharacterized RDD family membrane protein YckC